ncbi:MAG TPA: phospholipase D-like domain-containing protein, partial [Actinopolymorphaceae bacterium]
MTRQRSTRFPRPARVVISALAVVATVLTGPAEAAEEKAPLAPVTGALFNQPTGTTAEQYRIRDHIRALVDAAPAGSAITMSIYNITDHERGFADAVIAAAGRGVRVRAVFESTNAGTGSAQAIIAALGRDRTKPSWAVVCTEGCMGSKINHNKFFLFSEVSGQANVVVQTSANLTISNAEKFWNNAVTIVGNSALYQAYLDYFEDLARN